MKDAAALQREQEREMYDPQSPAYIPNPSVLPQIDDGADWVAHVSLDISSTKAQPPSEIKQSSAECTKQK